MSTTRAGLVSLWLIVLTLVVGTIAVGWALQRWLNSPPDTSARANQTPSSLSQVHDAPTQQMPSSVALRANVPALPDDAALDDIDPSRIGAMPWSDEEFHRLTELLEKYPELLAQLALEFRLTTDRGRLRRLAQLLGQFDHPLLIDVGEELAFSGEPTSQRAGLSLLGKQQSRNPRARAAITELLTPQTHSNVLTAALNAMSTAATVSDHEKRDLLQRFTQLADSEDSTVRALSLSVIARWAGDVDMNNVLLTGLNDPHAKVRENAAFALLKSQYRSDEAKAALFARAQDADEAKRTREAAIYALQRFSMTEAETAQLDQARQGLRGVR